MHPGWKQAAQGYVLKSASVPNNAVPVEPATGFRARLNNDAKLGNLGKVGKGFGAFAAVGSINDTYGSFTDKNHENYNDSTTSKALGAAGTAYTTTALAGSMLGKGALRSIPFAYAPMGIKATADASSKGKWIEMGGEALATLTSLLPGGGWSAAASLGVSAAGQRLQQKWDASHPSSSAQPMDYWQEQEARRNGTYPGMANSPANQAASTSWFGGDDKPAVDKDKEDVLGMLRGLFGGQQQAPADDGRWTPAATAQTSWRRLSGMPG